MKKRLLALLLALSMLAALTACGGEKAPEQEETKDTVEDVTPEEVPEAPDESVEDPETEEPENLPADPDEKPEANDKPADTTQKPESTPVQKPEENVPAKPPVEKPAGSESVDLGAFYESIVSGTANWPAMMALEDEILDVCYPGLSAIGTKYCGVYMPMISAVVCEIALVEVENAADVQAVKDIFQARIDYQVGDDTNPGGAWYPASIESWKNDSRIVANGNYVMMVAYSGADAVVDSFNALFA